MIRLFILFTIPTLLLSCNQNRREKEQDGENQQTQEEVEADIEASTNINEGQKVPEFTFTTTSGEEFSIKALQGKVVLLNFFATWCPTCMKEMPALQNQIWQKYRDNEDFFLVSIGREQNMTKMKDFKKEKGYNFHFAPDTGRVIYGKFADKFIPRNVVVDEQGNIVYQNTGYTEEKFQQMMDVIADELKN
ncbi:MAG: TlpA family protein disulfide reductase [Bacteroidota bacterium]